MLQQALLVISQKYPALGLKLSWTLFANMSDYVDKKMTQVQQAASVCLLMQVELAITGVFNSTVCVCVYVVVCVYVCV